MKKMLAHLVGRLALLTISTGLLTAQAGTPPQVGDTATNFTLKTLDDKSVELQKLTAKQVVVLVVLRGWPNYQCPICTSQAQDYIKHAAEFEAASTKVLFVYPGPADKLKEHAQEFLQDKTWPKNFLFVTDPDYSFTQAYNLRWDAPYETAYPSTFVIDKANKVRFAGVSREHGGRVEAAVALKAAQNIK